MKARLLFSLIILSLCAPLPRTLAVDTTAAPSDVKAELAAVTAKINAKVAAGQKTEQDLAGEFQELDALLQQHQGEQTDDVAGILLLKSRLYYELFGNTAKSVELLNQLKAGFPETTPGKQADAIIKAITWPDEARKIQAALAVGTAFPDFVETDLDDKPLSLASYRGKVVLISFWGTGYKSCLAELPTIIGAYRTYHDQGFEIIGVSLDVDREKLTAFLKVHEISWPQFFDGKGGNNKLALQYGVMTLPANYLLDGKGRIVGKNLRGTALEAEIASLFEKK
jgi:peroxiredoxin